MQTSLFWLTFIRLPQQLATICYCPCCVPCEYSWCMLCKWDTTMLQTKVLIENINHSWIELSHQIVHQSMGRLRCKIPQISLYHRLNHFMFFKSRYLKSISKSKYIKSILTDWTFFCSSILWFKFTSATLFFHAIHIIMVTEYKSR